MGVEEPQIDPYLFERHLEAFRSFVEEKAGVEFVSFASHPYTEEQEGYKYDIARVAREALNFGTWKKSDIGTGKIVESTINSIEISKNNLVSWHTRYGETKRPQQPLHEAIGNPEKLASVEACLFSLFRESKEPESFDELLGIFGKQYPLIAYFFFIKDRSRFLPVAPSTFDKTFRLLGAEFKTTQRCSWENYSTYLGLITNIKEMLADALSAEVTLLDAHSFGWILSSQMEKEKKLADVRDYLNLSDTEREAIVKARVGQGQFREILLRYWLVCAVTACTEHKLLRASHIKPWSTSNPSERLSLYNGLLLSPALDMCFDSGFVSFEDSGKIIISDQLDENDLTALGIRRDMRLSRVEAGHQQFLAYHREHVLRDE